MLLQNKSISRTIIHNDDEKTYRIDPLATADVPDDVAHAILMGWPIAEAATEDKPNLPREPWEWKCGETWKKAKLEFNLGEPEAVKETVGPSRPPVVEPVVPDDARDVDTGRVITDKLSPNICPSCEQAFPTLKGVRLHQRRVHKS